MQTWGGGGGSPIMCGIVAIRYGPRSNICHETLELLKSQAARRVCTTVESSEQRGRLQPCGLVSPPSLCFIKMRSFTKPGRKKREGEWEWVREWGGGDGAAKWNQNESERVWSRESSKTETRGRRGNCSSMTTQAWPSCAWWHASPQAVTAKWVRTANMTQGQCEASHTLEQERSYYTHTHPRSANTGSHVWFITVRFINTDS